MSHATVVNGVRVIVLEATEDAKCELCGVVAELRPYGPNGENICFDCGKADTQTTERRMGQVLFGEQLN